MRLDGGTGGLRGRASPDRSATTESASEGNKGEPVMTHLGRARAGTAIEGPAEWADLDNRRIRVQDALPIVVVHAVCLGAIWTGWSWTAVAVAIALYLIRMFVITAFYHRY